MSRYRILYEDFTKARVAGERSHPFDLAVLVERDSERLGTRTMRIDDAAFRLQVCRPTGRSAKAYDGAGIRALAEMLADQVLDDLEHGRTAVDQHGVAPVEPTEQELRTAGRRAAELGNVARLQHGEVVRSVDR